MGASTSWDPGRDDYVVGFGLGTAIFGMFYLLSLYMQGRAGRGVAFWVGVAFAAASLLATFRGIGLAYLTQVSVAGS